MFRTADIEKIVKYSIVTGFIKRDTAPISLMIVAPPESNKTSILKQFDGMRNVKYTVDLSGKPLVEFLKNARDNKFHHLIVPDFIKIVSHKQHIVGTVITTLNAMIEEGVRTSMYYGQELDLKKNVQCGLITSITPSLYKQQFKAWNDIGFLSRFLTVSYEYSEQTRSDIMKLISEDGSISFDETLTKIKRGGSKRININDNISAGLRLYTEDLTKKLQSYYVTIWRGDRPQKIYMDIQGFRLLKQLRLMIKAIAFDKGLDEVDYTCLEELKRLLEYVSMPDNPKVI